MRVLLDTCTFLWLTIGAEELSALVSPGCMPILSTVC